VVARESKDKKGLEGKQYDYKNKQQNKKHTAFVMEILNNMQY